MDTLGHKSKIFVPQHPYWLFLLFALPRLHWPESTGLKALHPLLSAHCSRQKKFKVMNGRHRVLIFELQVKFVLWSGLIIQFYHEILLQ